MVPDQPEREGRLHDQLLELESIRSAGLLTAAEHKSKREAVISRWEESLRQREVIETTLAENKAKTQQLLHALRATVKHGSDLLSKKQMAGVRQAYLELTGLSSVVAASRPTGEPSGTKRRAEDALEDATNKTIPITVRALEKMIRFATAHAKLKLHTEVTQEDVEIAFDLMQYALYANSKDKYDESDRQRKRQRTGGRSALDIDRETLGSLPDKPLDDLEDSGAPAPAPVTPDEVPPAPTEEEEPQEPEEEARRREWEAAKGIAAVAPVRREPLPQKRGRPGRKNGSSLYRGVTFCKHRGKWVAQVRIKDKHYYLGGYKEEEMAAKAFDKAVIKFRGKDAETNFPPEEYAEEMREMPGSVEDFICELKRKAEEDKPKPTKNGFLLFYDHVRDRVKEDLTADLAEGKKLTTQATLSAIAALWREQDKETKDEWQARAKELRAAVDQTPERAAVEVGPSTSRDAKAAGADGPGPSKRPRHEGEGEAITRELVEVHRHVTHAEYYARVADLYHSNKNAAGYENVQLKLES